LTKKEIPRAKLTPLAKADLALSLKHFNANCTAKITGNPHDTCYRNQAEYFDIEGILRARRLDWVGKTLRTTIPSLAREVSRKTEQLERVEPA